MKLEPDSRFITGRNVQKMSKIVQLKKEENLKKPETLGYINFDNSLHFGINREEKIWKKKEKPKKNRIL